MHYCRKIIIEETYIRVPSKSSQIIKIVQKIKVQFHQKLQIALKFHNANQILLNILTFINVFFYLHFWKKILTEETYNSLPGKIDTCAQKWVSRNTNFESNWTKVEWHKISICKCEFFLTFNVEKHFAIWIGQVQ